MDDIIKIVQSLEKPGNWKKTKSYIFKIQSDDSIMCGFYFIAFIEYMLAGKKLLDYTNLFSLHDYQKNEKIIYK